MQYTKLLIIAFGIILVLGVSYSDAYGKTVIPPLPGSDTSTDISPEDLFPDKDFFPPDFFPPEIFPTTDIFPPDTLPADFPPDLKELLNNLKKYIEKKLELEEAFQDFENEMNDGEPLTDEEKVELEKLFQEQEEIKILEETLIQKIQELTEKYSGQEPKPDNVALGPDWNDGGLGLPGGGDPLLFSLTEKPVKTIRNWSEQHESFLTQFDLYDVGYPVTLSRTLDEGTMTLFLDLDGNGMLSEGTEWLFDQNEDVYTILARPFIDSNQNGFFDYLDNLWSIAMIKEGDQYHFASDLGIIAFNWSNAEHFEDDRYGRGVYSDCLYEGVYLYPFCKPVSDEHFRITSYNEQGIWIQNGKHVPTFGGVMGHLDMGEHNFGTQ